MKITLIDESGLRGKDGKFIVKDITIHQFEVPDKMVEEFKTCYEIWVREQKENSKGGKQ